MMAGQTLLGNRYRLGTRIGRGGMGEIRMGLDTRLGRVVAVKQLSGALATDPAARARFHREAQAAARLSHPAVVALLDSGEEWDARTGTSTPYIVMELVVGQTLRTLLQRGQRVSPERALELVQGILDALAHSHAAGILHQDIK